MIKKIRQLLLKAPHTNEELINSIEAAKNNALIDNDSFRMIQGVLTLENMTASDIMVPRSHMKMLDENMTLTEALPIVTSCAHSRFPVINATENKILGILLAKDLLQLIQEGDLQKKIQQLLRPAVLIPESKRLNILLREFRLKHNHMAIVIDEYGNIDGLVTIEDVLERVVGNILDEHDADEKEIDYIKQVDVNIAELSAMTPLPVFNDYFEKKYPADNHDTIGGLVLQTFSHLPKEGETIELDDLEITVLEATDRGIKRLRVYRNV